MNSGIKKEDLRKEYRQKRHSLILDKKQKLSFTQNIYSILSTFSKHETIAGYIAIDGELDIIDTLSQYQFKATIALPEVRQESKVLIFRSWDLTSKLIRSELGFQHSRYGKIVIPDIILVPLVAFDHKLHRIGMGGGYYDSTIRYYKEQKHETMFIGIAYDDQYIGNLPSEEYDQSLHCICTERFIYYKP